MQEYIFYFIFKGVQELMNSSAYFCKIILLKIIIILIYLSLKRKSTSISLKAELYNIHNIVYKVTQTDVCCVFV